VQDWKLNIYSIAILPPNFKYSVNEDENMENYKIMRRRRVNCGKGKGKGKSKGHPRTGQEGSEGV
jgi:hypothetical protein